MNKPFESVFLLSSSEPANREFGTSFAIHRDDKYLWLLTCAHVVRDVGGLDKVRIAGQPGESVCMGSPDGPDDLAIFRIVAPPRVSALPLSRKGAPGDLVSLIGYRRLVEQRESRPLRCVLGKQTSIESPQNWSARIETWTLDVAEDEKDVVVPGYSGSPVLLRDAVVGVVSHQLDGEGRRALAISMGALDDLWPEMASDLLRRKKSPPPLAVQESAHAESETGGPEPSAPECVVVRSDADRHARRKLITVVSGIASVMTRHQIGAPRGYFASDAVASKPVLRDVVQELCRSRVAVFDLTNFEPAVMLLLGIRAVARRGVTILSLGGDYALGDQVAIPFNIADANVVAHSEKQWQGGRVRPTDLLRQRIERGLDQVDSIHYLDLAVFQAIRNLPPERRTMIPNEEGALVLCPFDPKYTEKIWLLHMLEGLRHRLEQLRAQRDELRDKPATLRIARSFELESPRLVSQAVYEYIRRVQTCVVDWTLWSPNVFFELGIRLAASSRRTACMIDGQFRRGNARAADQPDEHPEAFLDYSRTLCPESEGDRLRSIVGQGEKLLNLFSVIQYQRDLDPLEDTAYREAYGSDATTEAEEHAIGPSSQEVYDWVAEALDVAKQPAARAVFDEILDSALLFRRDAGKGSSVGLYPRNQKLVRAENQAELERLLAIWYFLVHHYGEHALLDDPERSRVCSQVVDRLLDFHEGAIDRLDEGRPGEDSLREALGEMQDKLPETYADELEE